MALDKEDEVQVGQTRNRGIRDPKDKYHMFYLWRSDILILNVCFSFSFFHPDSDQVAGRTTILGKVLLEKCKVWEARRCSPCVLWGRGNGLACWGIQFVQVECFKRALQFPKAYLGGSKAKPQRNQFTKFVIYVSYQLWKEIINLIQKHSHRHPE